ncbi:enoyl-CoA hydratase-related protein [Paracoccus sp. MC1862]|uniref:enoyl-CoA hydratase-related protein n=1 Tax=Paracoccus sp. MC1862 TaxID=2760307 RepID=UPI0016024AD0|nr:enoyl-CoA hydratase-related protein [Paracoccus sp. MC1862]MBB1499744.1 enoyl-CoA hydratase/isomerase family protein [Paracoccus sp. MC1862]QQO46615.1 enoyl-CoA hydratase/isomerase family protein [Paracoccus sp. MC1862]
MSYQTILTARDGAVGIITLNRPEALNALNGQITAELGQAVEEMERDDGINVIVLTGSDKAFAAGADIKEILDKTFIDVFDEQFITATWERIARCRKPTIAAVSGHAIGGGFELAMMCDIIIAAECARFALPETKIGIIPGAGGTQRLTRVGGKALAMDMILTGRRLAAEEARAHGLVSRVVPDGEHLTAAIAIAQEMAQSSRPILLIAKEAVNKAYETHLAEGIHLERRLLYSTFAIEDRREGMTAFSEKRKPRFRNR